MERNNNSKRNPFAGLLPVPKSLVKAREELEEADADLRAAMEASKISADEENRRRSAVHTVDSAKDSKMRKLAEPSGGGSSSNAGFVARFSGFMLGPKAKDTEVLSYCPWTGKMSSFNPDVPLVKPHTVDGPTSETAAAVGKKVDPKMLDKLANLYLKEFDDRDHQRFLDRANIVYQDADGNPLKKLQLIKISAGGTHRRSRVRVKNDPIVFDFSTEEAVEATDSLDGSPTLSQSIRVEPYVFDPDVDDPHPDKYEPLAERILRTYGRPALSDRTAGGSKTMAEKLFDESMKAKPTGGAHRLYTPAEPLDLAANAMSDEQFAEFLKKQSSDTGTDGGDGKEIRLEDVNIGGEEEEDDLEMNKVVPPSKRQKVAAAMKAEETGKMGAARGGKPVRGGGRGGGRGKKK